uniref:Uncharacterized protein n=1 Tax=Sinocyclocheilus grahami TaxID=75366 RepID=A0A672LD08_SINGR
ITSQQSGLMEPEDPRDDSFDFLFKIILIGDSNVGKTSLVQSFKSGLFSEAQQNTIGVDFTVLYTVYNMHYLVCSVHCSIGSEQCSVCSI